MWESPIYRFRIPKDENNSESSKLKEIVIDVTGSAPAHNFITEDMKTAFNEMLDSEDFGKDIKVVLDFGAGKLKNTPHFLKKGRKTCAVEFRELGESSEKAKENLRICKNFKKLFENLIFPNPFIEHRGKYDLALLINVLPVMPIFAERLMVLQILYEKINDDKYILWYTQKEGGFYKDRRLKNKFNCGDGIWMGDNKRFKTFYKYHTPEEVDEMMLLCGFELKKKFSNPSNDVRLYKKTKYNLLESALTTKIVLKNIPLDKTIKDPQSVKPKEVKKTEKIKEILPNPSQLQIKNLYVKAFESIKEGETPYHYQRLVSSILARVFKDSLKNMKFEQDLSGVKKIDTIFSNFASEGFFKKLTSQHGIHCPYVVVEAKNYTFDPKNPEFDQVGGRLGDQIGRFGILVCRDIKDKNEAKKRCQSYLDSRNNIIFLTDNELIELLELSLNGETDDIDTFMDTKLREILFREAT